MTFNDLDLKPEILKSVADMGFEQPTEIQQRSIPILSNNEQDLIGLAQTGTGKTAAFGLPLLNNFQKQAKPYGLIIAPTRELCLQITKELQNFGKYLPSIKITPIYGGASVSTQLRDLKRGTDIIVATPGRLLDMMRRGAANLSEIQVVILDEADEMLQMGFIDDINTILAEASEDRSTWLFSATMPSAIQKITKQFMTTPETVQVGKRNEGSQNVEHSYFLVQGSNRVIALRRLLDAAPNIYGIVFCNTKRETQELADQLIKGGYTASALHGDLTQQQRDMVMKAFRNKHVRILVATDVAARGIDVDDVTHVIHYGLPHDSEGYNHRSGRTGRAGKEGESWVIATKKEAVKIPQIQKKIGKSIHKKLFPTATEICQMQINHFAQKVASTKADVEVVKPYLTDLLPMFENMSKEDVVSYFLAEEFDSLFRHYENAVDLNTAATEYVPRNEYRYGINVGQEDGFTWMLLKDWLRDAGGLKRYAIEGVEVYNDRSEFSVRAEEEEKLLAAFENVVWEGTTIKLRKLKDGRIKGQRYRGKGAPGGGRNKYKKRDNSGGGFNAKRNGRGGSFKPKDKNKGYTGTKRKRS